MRKVIEYKLVHYWALTDVEIAFERKVNEAIEEGFQPVGAAFKGWSSHDSNYSQLCQTMVKYEEMKMVYK